MNRVLDDQNELFKDLGGAKPPRPEERQGWQMAWREQKIFKGLLRFDRRLRLTRMPGRKG